MYYFNKPTAKTTELAHQPIQSNSTKDTKQGLKENQFESQRQKLNISPYKQACLVSEAQTKIQEIKKKYQSRQKGTQLIAMKATQTKGFVTKFFDPLKQTTGRINLQQQYSQPKTEVAERKKFNVDDYRIKFEMSTESKVWNNVKKSVPTDIKSSYPQTFEKKNEELIELDLPSKKLQEQRIESIDKINQKIQNLMKSMNQNEKKQLKVIKYLSRPTDINNKNADNLYQAPVNQHNLEKLTNLSMNKFQKPKQQLTNPAARSTSVISKIIESPSDIYMLSNGKDIDAQIKKIQDKIRKSQQQKRRLNIKFENFIEYTREQKKTNAQKGEVCESNIKKVQRFQQEAQQKIQEKKKDEYVLPKQKLVSNVPRLSIPAACSSIKTPCFEETPKQKLIQKIQTKRLIECLKQQVILDQAFRESKLQFSLITSEQKWKELRQQLQRQQMFISQNQMKIDFALTPEQHDPFYSIRQVPLKIENLGKRYLQANDYWSKNIQKRFKRDVLLNQQFRQESLDLQKKGHLTVEDFVRFLNIETGTFYRNRDIVLIFRRIKTTATSITFKELINAIVS